MVEAIAPANTRAQFDRGEPKVQARTGRSSRLGDRQTYNGRGGSRSRGVRGVNIRRGC